jgi:hypothetical protein
VSYGKVRYGTANGRLAPQRDGLSEFEPDHGPRLGAPVRVQDHASGVNAAAA